MYIQVCTQVMYSIVGSHLCISLIFSSFSRRAIGRFQHYNSRTHSITKKPTENFRQVHKIEQTHKQLCTFRYVHRSCTILQVLIYVSALCLAHIREGLQPVFAVLNQASVVPIIVFSIFCFFSHAHIWILHPPVLEIPHVEWFSFCLLLVVIIWSII